MQKDKNVDHHTFSEDSPVSDLRSIPGVGTNIERHMHNIGIRCVADLKGRDPEELYQLDCLKKALKKIAARCMCTVVQCILPSMRSARRKN